MDRLAPWIGFFSCAAAIAWSGSRLARLGERLSVSTGLGGARMGLVATAVSNLLGSDPFGIALLAIDDFTYHEGLRLEDASDAHLVMVFSSVTMSAIGFAGLIFRSVPKRLLLAWDTFLIALLYLANLIPFFRIA